MRDLTSNSNFSQIGNVSRFPTPVRVPDFQYYQDKWASCRTLNVDVINHTWNSQPHLVRVFSDRKLGNNSVVMLKKNVFEDLVKQLKDIQNGEIVLQSNLEALFDQVRMVTVLFEQVSPNLPQLHSEPMVLAMRSLQRVTGQIKSTLQYAMPPKQVSSSPLTEEELELAKALDLDDE